MTSPEDAASDEDQAAEEQLAVLMAADAANGEDDGQTELNANELFRNLISRRRRNLPVGPDGPLGTVGATDLGRYPPGHGKRLESRPETRTMARPGRATLPRRTSER